MPRRSSTTSGDFRIGGVQDRSWPSVSAAINVASRRAEMAEREVQIGVYEGERKVYRVTRETDGIVTIQAVTEGGDR